jgi:hypothetical protein
MRRLNLLLLCDYQRSAAATINDHIDAIGRYSRHKVRTISLLGDLPAGLDLSRFDGVIIHYTLIACMDAYLSAASRRRLAVFKGVKAMFIQDEYRFVNATIAAMREIGIDVLFTCFPKSEIDNVYSEERLPGVAKYNVLTGYVPSALLCRPFTPPSARAIDIGYRGRTLPAWYGELGQEKLVIGDRVKADAPNFGLKVDISSREADRIYGRKWIEFISSCKAMLGVESGVSVVDFSGDIQRQTEQAQRDDPSLSFAELKGRYFSAEDGAIIMNQISPRSFECAALRTPMILYEGDYSGVLTPWLHYIPLKKDHSNFGQVVDTLRDGERLDEIADRAYRDVALNPRYSYSQSVADVDSAIDEVSRISLTAIRPHTPFSFAMASIPTFKTFRRRTQRRARTIFQRVHAAIL